MRFQSVQCRFTALVMKIGVTSQLGMGEQQQQLQ
jgi:hypothetical protein